MHGFQIWVNLPRSHKMVEPRYQELPHGEIPLAQAEGGAISVKVIAGECMNTHGRIDTVTPITLLHLRMTQGTRFKHDLPTDQRGMVYIFAGEGKTGSESRGSAVTVRPGHHVVLSEGRGELELLATSAAPLECLIMAGVPIEEPMARQGPFVMNTADEVRQAFLDYQFGEMGHL